MGAVRKLAGIPAGRRTKWVVLVFWVAVFAFAGQLAGKLNSAQQNDASSWLPHNAESTQVVDLAKRFTPSDIFPALVVYEHTDGTITTADQAKVAADVRRFAGVQDVTGRVLGPIPSRDRKALQVVVPVKVAEEGNGWEQLAPRVKEMRSIASEPSLPALIGTTTWRAAPSLARTGPPTGPPMLSIPAKRRTSAATLAWSAALTAPSRSYTTTAGTVSLGVNRLARSTTRVDSAFLGSEADASFFSTPVSLPASGPATMTTTTHAARTAHFVQRPHGILTMRRIRFLHLDLRRPAFASVAPSGMHATA